jgi:hypothetical protein
LQGEQIQHLAEQSRLGLGQDPIANLAATSAGGPGIGAVCGSIHSFEVRHGGISREWRKSCTLKKKYLVEDQVI